MPFTAQAELFQHVHGGDIGRVNRIHHPVQTEFVEAKIKEGAHGFSSITLFPVGAIEQIGKGGLARFGGIRGEGAVANELFIAFKVGTTGTPC